MNGCLDGNLNTYSLRKLINETRDNHRKRKDMKGWMCFHTEINYAL